MIQRRHPRHNESAIEVRRGKVGPRPRREGKIIRNAWKRHGYEWFDVGGNKDGAEEAL